MRRIVVLVLILLALMTGIVIVGIISHAHAQTTGVLVQPGKGLTFVYPGRGGSPTVIQPPTGPPSYYYAPATSIGIPSLPAVPTVPNLPPVYIPLPSSGGY